jgi:hypothetical protein
VATALVCIRHALAQAVVFQPWQIAVDYDKLVGALGAATPNGEGVSISQVEAPEGTPGRYVPDLTWSEFTAGTDPLGQPLTLIDGTGGALNGPSGHASGTVGQYFYGNTFGLASGANQLTVFEVNDWLINQVRYSNSTAPESQIYKVQNHSWVTTASNPGAYLPALQKFDYMLEQGDAIAVVGANNNGGFNPALVHPDLLAHSYNAIVAGRSDAGHSRGVTQSFYGGGRFKPDLVAPAGVTSTATAMISSAATIMFDAASGSNADHNETIKAMLMAGATKAEFASFVDPATGQANPWDHTPTRPLDDLFGAGELNVFNSYKIWAGGQQAGSASAPAVGDKRFGWDYKDFKSDGGVGDVYYNIVIPAGSTASELSVVLAWNAKVTDLNPAPAIFSPSVALPNLNLKLFDSSGGFLGSMLSESISAVDNVEHIYATNLGPGTYTLAVSGAANWDYGLAWRTATAFDVASADFDGDGEVGGSDVLTWQRGLGTLVNATHAQGDADGDGDVDAADLAVIGGQVTGPPALAALVQSMARALASGSSLGAISLVPEPSGVLLAVIAAGALTRAARRRR